MRALAPHRYRPYPAGPYLVPAAQASRGVTLASLQRYCEAQPAVPASGTRGAQRHTMQASSELLGSAEPRMQLLTFPLNGKELPPPVHGVIGPTEAIIEAMRALLKSAFGTSVTADMQRGWASVLLLEERSDELSQPKMGTRRGMKPFTKLVAACVFDVKSSGGMVHVPLFATEAKQAGRGFAKLLLAQLKVHAAVIADAERKEVVLVLPALPYTVPFWEKLGLSTSKPVNLVGATRAVSLRSLPQCNGTTDCFLSMRWNEVQRMEMEREVCVASVRDRWAMLEPPVRAAAAGSDSSDDESGNGSGSDSDSDSDSVAASSDPVSEDEKKDTTEESSKRHRGVSVSSSAISSSVAGKKRCSRGGETSSKKRSRAQRDAPSSQQTDKPPIAHSPSAPQPPRSKLSYSLTQPLTSDGDGDEPSWQQLHDAPLRPMSPSQPPSSDLSTFLLHASSALTDAFPLWGSPPVQHVHLRNSDFSIGSECVAAVQEGTAERPPRACKPTFRIEKCRIEGRCRSPRLLKVCLLQRPNRPVCEVPIGYLYQIMMASK